MIRYGAWDWASTLNSCGTSLMNFWKVTARSSWKVARSSPTETSYPSWACRRIASLMPNASTRVVLPLNTEAPTVNSMKSKYWLSGYLPLVRFRIFTMRTFCAGGMVLVSPQNDPGSWVGVVLGVGVGVGLVVPDVVV